VRRWLALAPSRGRGRPPRRVRLKGQALRRRAQNPPRNEPTHDALNEAIVEPEAQRELSSADRPAWDKHCHDDPPLWAVEPDSVE